MSASTSTSGNIAVPRTPSGNEKTQAHLYGQLSLPAFNFPTPPATQHRRFHTDGLLPSTSTSTPTRRPLQPFVNRLNGGITQGTGLGIGLGARNLPRRLRTRQKDNLESCFTKPAIRRLARRGGIKRINKAIYGDIQNVIKDRLSEILRITCAITDMADRKTITSLDVIYALKTLGTPLYGFGDVEILRPEGRGEYMRMKRAEALAEKERARERDERIRRAGGIVRRPTGGVVPSIEA